MVTQILILAAGQSSRMRGGDKAFETVRGDPLLRRQARMALEQGLPVYVAVPSKDHPRARLLDGLAVTQLAIPEATEGMSGTIRGSVARMPRFDRLLVLLSDLVDLQATDLAKVLNAPNVAPSALIWRGATETGAPGHPILFDGSLRDSLLGISGDDGASAVVQQNRDRLHPVPLQGDRARRDLDTPEDWARWRKENGDD